MRLERLEDLLGRLEGFRARGRGSYEEDVEARLATQHALQLAIQICIDVAAHLVAASGRPAPDRYQDLFSDLRGDGLDERLAQGLSQAAGLRNILVHDYLDVDDGVIWGALDHLDELRDFAAFALARLD